MKLEPGKLPAPLLAELLGGLGARDPRVLVGPAIGRDAAVIEFGDRALVVETDPITFASERAAWYAVHVNANDIACMGARPAWFLATVLLPPGGDDALVRTLFRELEEACIAADVALVGGHTEVTPGLDRPIISGVMLGEAARDDIVAGDARAGDVILLTKGIAIEGTALLAREARDELRRRGVEAAVVERATEMLFDPGISVVPDARALQERVKPRLMHDPTEGGLSTALYEMSEAARAVLRIRPEAVLVFEETERICAAASLDPMGLLASGALLAIVAADDAGPAQAALEGAGIPCAIIGQVEQGAPGVILGAGNAAAPFPAFARDELARFFDRPAGRPRPAPELSEGTEPA